MASLRAQADAKLGRALIPALVIAVILLAAALRFHRLGAQSLWYDEGLAYGHSLRSLPELIANLQPNVHVPAYFALLGWWQDATGSSEFALRSLSALFSVIGVAFAYALGKQLFHPLAGLAAAALVALNSFSVYYAQEARMYAMLTAVAAGSMWIFIDLLRIRARGESRRGDWRKIFALGLINALGVYTHFAYAFVMLAQAALVALGFFRSFIGERNRARRWLRVSLAHVLTLILFAPWLPVAIAQLGNRTHRLQHLPADEIAREILGVFAFGSAYELSADGAAVAAIGVLLLCGLLPAAAGPRGWWRALLPAAWTLISVAAFLLVGFGDGFLRFLLPAQLAMALWLGRGFWVLWRLRIDQNYSFRLSLPVQNPRPPAPSPTKRAGEQWMRAIPTLGAALALAVFLPALLRGLDALYHHPDFQRDDMRGLAAGIESQLRAGDALIVSAPGLEELLRYYYRAEAPIYPLPLGGDDDATRAQVLEIIAAHDRLHVIFYGAEQQDPNRIVERTLNFHALEFADRWVDDLRYVQYLARPALGERERLEADFGGLIALESFALGASPVSPSDVLPARLVWRAIESPERRYKVFLQLLDGDGALAAQRDSEPAGGSSMTTSWEVGDTIVDSHGLLIPADLPAGDYRLIAGLYAIDDPAARLMADESSFVELGTIKIGDEH